jgi:hypothetical protein
MRTERVETIRVLLTPVDLRDLLDGKIPGLDGMAEEIKFYVERAGRSTVGLDQDQPLILEVKRREVLVTDLNTPTNDPADRREQGG